MPKNILVPSSLYLLFVSTYKTMEIIARFKNNEIFKDIDSIIAAEIKVKSNRDEPIAKIMSRLESTKRSTEILIEQKVRETMKNPSMVDMIDKMYDEALNEKYKEIQALEKQLNDQSQFASCRKNCCL